MIYLVTQNKGKLAAAERSFAPFGIKLSTVAKDYAEIQADTSMEIARAGALAAAKELGAQAIREDHSLCIRHLGIPGPYTQYVERHIPVAKLLELLKDAPDRTGYFELAAVYAEPDGFTKECSYTVEIHIIEHEIAPDPRGGWGGLLALKGETRAFSEYSESERLSVWSKNFETLAAFINDRSK
jgi:XTP/dITP diphosphohydrolase